MVHMFSTGMSRKACAGVIVGTTRSRPVCMSAGLPTDMNSDGCRVAICGWLGTYWLNGLLVG